MVSRGREGGREGVTSEQRRREWWAVREGRVWGRGREWWGLTVSSLKTMTLLLLSSICVIWMPLHGLVHDPTLIGDSFMWWWVLIAAYWWCWWVVMDNCRCWVGTHGIGLLYPFIDGGGHSLMVVDAHWWWWTLVDGGGHGCSWCQATVSIHQWWQTLVDGVDACHAAKGVLGIPGCWWWLRRKMFVEVYLLMLL